MNKNKTKATKRDRSEYFITSLLSKTQHILLKMNLMRAISRNHVYFDEIL